MTRATKLLVVCFLWTVVAGCAATPPVAEPSSSVVARCEKLTQGHYVPEYIEGTKKWKPKKADDRQYDMVFLENEFVRVQVIPELGGVVHRAFHKPSGCDYFFYEGLLKEWYTFWESGVKASFPKAEHGMRNLGQPASYRIYTGRDGSRTIALWMEFSRHHGTQGRRGGKMFSRMMLSQLVTVRPNESMFRITYRIVNPSPYRQGRRVWNDAFYPRNHVGERAVQAFQQPPEETLTELIYPIVYLSFHRGEQFRKWQPEERLLGKITQRWNSYFAWDIPHGFCGLWYPKARVNRLRLCDPKTAPGAKVYFEGEDSYGEKLKFGSNYNFVEIWGGTDNLFEGVENWIGPGESFEFTHAFAMAAGIGKVDFADERLAVNVELEGQDPKVEIVTFRPVTGLVVSLDGKPLGAAECGPGRPARFALPGGKVAGKLSVTADGAKMLDRKFPLELPDDTTGHERIRWSLSGRRPDYGEMMGDHGEGGGHRGSIRRFPEGSVGRGRNLYRDGQLGKAVECLKKATSSGPEDGEGWHLLGAALLEKGNGAAAMEAFEEALDVKRAYQPARYFLALELLKKGDSRKAMRELKKLIGKIPAHWEAKLLLAWLTGSLEQALELEREDPADPRVQEVIIRAAKGRDKSAGERARRVLESLSKEPGAGRRLEEFRSATQGKYMPPFRVAGP